MDLCLFYPGCHDACRLDDYIQVLEKEVNIDFCRCMNRIVFDKTVVDEPKSYAFVTLPDIIEEVIPERGE